MRKSLSLTSLYIALIVYFMLISVKSNAQILQVEILGGAVVTQGSTVTINAGSSLTFRATNIETINCGQLYIQDIDISNTTDFDISPNNPWDKIKPSGCNGDKYLDFEIENNSGSCASSSTLVTVKIKNQSDFTFTLQVNSSPEIYVLGGSPFADIMHNASGTNDTNGTYFGDVEDGASVTRRFVIANIGSCDMNITSVTSNNPDFTASSIFGIPYNNLPPYYGIYVDVTFTAPTGGIGTQAATISIFTTDPNTNPFFLNVSAEMFNENIPGPGGITSGFKLWLKSTRGIVKTGSAVTDWLDLGTNLKHATTVSGKEPTYIDTPQADINFNPVIKFENDGSGVEQYMYNGTSGFYNHDIFIVMVPDATMNSSSNRNTILSGINSGNPGDITGVGFGDYSSEFTGETLSYNQDVPNGGSFNGDAQIGGSSYSNAGIINVRNDLVSSPTKQDILYNSHILTTSNVTESAFTNINASKYWIGRNQDVQGSLNGRVAEVFTFAERLTDADRQKVESYLAIKYGITLGASNEAQKNYINSFGKTIWDISANAGFNYDVAGIGRDSISDLNQKQSKTINSVNGVIIGLGGIFSKNSANPNEFEDDGDFLVWGNDNGALTGTNSDVVTLATGITTSYTRIDRKWKIVENFEALNGDVETVYIGIPVTAFSAFTKTSDEEYALIVADNPAFGSADVIDIIPLKIHVDALGVPILDGNGNQVYKTWYDFHATNYFTFGKVSRLEANHSINFDLNDYLVGESNLNLNQDYFTISAWVKAPSNASERTIMAKGEKLQLRLNAVDKVEVIIDAVTPKLTSNMAINDNKWHQITLVYNSGTLLLYIDGVLDHSEKDIVHPSPNYRNFSIGAVYYDRETSTNPFLGKIDEAYVWDLALKENQIRYLMNQEVEKITGGFVSGKVNPSGASSNEVSTIPWSNLRAYYDFNSFYGSTVEGLTNERNFLRLRYLNKDKNVVSTQTTPVPYMSATSGAWDNPATWVSGADNVLPNGIGLDGQEVDWNIVQISHDITSGDRDIKLLGLIINNSGTLTIADPVVTTPVENNSGQSLTITHYLELDGVIDLVGESQLIQTEGSIIDADSGGYIERDQQGTANGFNYNYWSSSVGPIGGNATTMGTGVAITNASNKIEDFLLNGYVSSSPLPMTFEDVGYDFTPSGPTGFLKIFTYWLYKFYGAADDYNAWEKIDETSSLLPGEGFTMKGPAGTAPIAERFNYVFKGLPYNGDITLALNKTSGDVERLIGNPYPSAIDAEEFILDNISATEGGNNAQTVINGALYFWDHFGEENSHYLKDYVGGYATYNLTGGTAAISNDIRINNTGAFGTKVPGRYIPVNQGFFVSTKLESQPNDNLDTIASVLGGNIIFKNSQRVFVTELEESSPGVPVSVFMKSSKAEKVSTGSKKDIQDKNPIIRLEYISPLGYHRQLVLGTNKNASNGFNLGYDAFMVDVNQEDMYWYFNNSKFVIQGVGEFNPAQEYSLGLIIKKSGVAKIKIEAFENMESAIPVYIKDDLTGEIKNITSEAFEIHLDPGVYNNRFKLVFQSSQNALLSANGIVEEPNNLEIYYYSKTSKLEIINKNNLKVYSATMFNTLGQELKTLKLNTRKNVSLPVSGITGLYIVKLNTENGIVSKKIIIE